MDLQVVNNMHQKTKLGGLLEEANKKRKDLAEAVGVDVDTVTRWSRLKDDGIPQLRFRMERLPDLVDTFNEWITHRKITETDLVEDNLYFMNELLVVGVVNGNEINPLLDHFKIVPPWQISGGHNAYIMKLNADSNAYIIVNNRTKLMPDSRQVINAQCIINFKDLTRRPLIAGNIDRLDNELKLTEFNIVACTDQSHNNKLFQQSILMADVAYIQLITGILLGNYSVIE